MALTASLSLDRPQHQHAVGVLDEACSCAAALEGDLGQVYNEEGFRYFLEIERNRSEVSNRPLFLMLAELRNERGADESIAPATAARLFAGLAGSLRETDFIGWYRESRIAGAVLTQRADSVRTEVSLEVKDRVMARLARSLPPADARRLDVRVYQIPPRFDEQE